MKAYLFLFLPLSLAPALAAAESIPHSLQAQWCDSKKHCSTTNPGKDDASGGRLEFNPISGKAVGHDAWIREATEARGVKIRTEIHVIRYEPAGKYAYYVYVMLRTGRRNGIIRTWNLQRWEDLAETVVTDRPYPLPNGTLTASLKIGPGRP